MTNTDLQGVLTNCQKSAKAGYKIASEHEKSLREVLSAAETKIRRAILDFKASPCYAPETARLLETQLLEIDSSFNNLAYKYFGIIFATKENP